MSTVATMGLGRGIATALSGARSTTAGKSVGFPGHDAEALRLRREWMMAMGLSAEEAELLSHASIPALDVDEERRELEAADRLKANKVSYGSLKVILQRAQQG